MKKKILYFAYYFPPTGGGGVQRNLKFIKYLSRNGFTPIVVTIDNEKTYKTDDSLINDISSEIKIYRLKDTHWKNSLINKKNNKLIRILFEIFFYLFCIPDEQTSWFNSNKKKILSIVKDEGINIVYTSSTPYSTSFFGEFIKKNIPEILWIADFRDAWITNPGRFVNILFRSIFTFRNLFEKKIEKRILANADKIISASEGITTDFIKRHKLFYKQDDFSTITNGYDPEDFINISPQKTNKFTISYYGTFSVYQHPLHFFKAFKQFYATLTDSDKHQIQLNFIGKTRYKKETLIFAREVNMEDRFYFSDYQPHDKVINIGASSDLLLLFIGKGYYTDVIYTGKIFEYLYLGIPMLAMVPLKSQAARLIRRTQTGYISDFDDIESIKSHLQSTFELWKTGKLQHNYDQHKQEEIIKEYSREKLTQKLISLINKSLEKR